MEKLEQILHAEDAARARVAEAREQAAEIERASLGAVATTRAAVIEDAVAKATARGAAVIAEAREALTEAETAAALEREQVLAAADARFGEAVERVVGELGV